MYLPVSMKSLLKATALFGVTIFSGAFLSAASAQQLPPLPIEFNPDNLINPGRPGGRRRGGGSRGICQAGLPLTAISYADSRTVQELGVTSTDETVGMLTTQVQPTLWFYVPTALDDVATEFIVKNVQDQVVYEGRLSGETEGTGIIGVPLAAEMAVGTAYRWFLTVDCDETERVTVDGWVERRATGPDATRTLRQASARNRAALYANYGFLQDAVSELAVMRMVEPDDEAISLEWRRLLSALDLPELANVAVLPCCELADASAEVPVEVEVDVPVDVEVEEIEVLETVNEAEPEESEDPRSVLERARERGN